MENTNKQIRVVMSKVGLDCHDRGVKAVAHFLREAGMEVIYTGMFSTVEEVVNIVIQEDADVLGISCLTSEHLTFVTPIMEGIKAQGIDDLLVVVGGAIPVEDVGFLKENGVHGVFCGAVPMSRIVDFIHSSLLKQI
jgi:methylmalonyl-CoA mutase C-terminal domain/subunit